LYGAPPIRVIVGEDAHAAVRKSVSLLGMGNSQIEVVPVDDQGRMRLDRFPCLATPSLVVAQAGNVNSGGFDPIGEVCERTHDGGGWVHVDGAFGLWAAASPSLAHLHAGIDQADSWAADAHKTLNVPYDCGIVLCRNREALLRAFHASASYFQWSEHRDPMNYTPSMSKRARAVALWAILKTLGRDGVARLVEQLCENARYFGERLKIDGFHVHNDIVFNQVLASCRDDRETTNTLKQIQASGECWCGGATWKGQKVIRVSVCSWATTKKDIDRALAAFSEARRIAKEQDE
jgi:glutamate/tyrosine decarboxylase-like PLP-dependent enzyme